MAIVTKVDNPTTVGYGPRQIYVVMGGISPDQIPIVPKPNLLVREQGSSQFLVKPPRRNLKNGVAGTPQIYDTDIVSNAGLSGTSTLVITGAISGNNKTYTFVNASPTSNQILIGATAADTEENIRAAIQADLVFFGFQSVEIVSGKVRITGPASGTAFATPSSNESSAVIAFTSVQTNIPAVLSLVNFEFATIANTAPVAGQVISAIAGVLINGTPDDFIFNYIVQPGQTIATALTAMATQLRKLFAVSSSPVVLTNAFVGLRENTNYTIAQIKAAASAIFQDATASGNILTISAVANESLTSLTAKAIGINILPPEYKVLVDENGVPLIEGIEGFGRSTVSVTATNTSNRADFFTQESKKVYFSFATEKTQSITLDQIQRDTRVAYITNSDMGMTSGVDSSTYLPDGVTADNVFGLIAVQPSRHLPGSYDLLIAPVVTASEFLLGMQKAPENFTTITGTILSRSNETEGFRVQVATPTKLAA